MDFENHNILIFMQVLEPSHPSKTLRDKLCMGSFVSLVDNNFQGRIKTTRWFGWSRKYQNKSLRNNQIKNQVKFIKTTFIGSSDENLQGH